MMLRRCCTGLALSANLCVLLSPVVVYAQSSTSDESLVRLRHFEGSVLLQRAAVGETESALINLPLGTGDRVWTERGGRAELQFADGSMMWLDEESRLDIVSLRSRVDGPSAIVRIWNGSLYLERPEPERRGSDVLRIDAPAGSVVLSGAGVYRVDVDEERRLWLSVYDGYGDLVAAGVSEALRGGEQSFAEVGTAPARAASFNTAEEDAFAAWRGERITANARTDRYVSEREYVPREIVHYVSELRDYGSWHYHNTYNSWYWRPHFGHGWSPYRYGRWVYTHHGWSWVPAAHWGYVTSHYGRWHFSVGLGWVWYPGHHYSPAWVHWYVSPHYVGWTPLNFFNRPVISINFFFGKYGHHGGYGYGGHRYNYVDYGGKGIHVGPGGSAYGGKVVKGRGYSLGSAWTFVESGKLGRGRVSDIALDSSDVAKRLKAVPRSKVQFSGPLRSRDPVQILGSGAGRRAVPRAGVELGGTTGDSGSGRALGAGAKGLNGSGTARRGVAVRKDAGFGRGSPRSISAGAVPRAKWGEGAGAPGLGAVAADSKRVRSSGRPKALARSPLSRSVVNRRTPSGRGAAVSRGSGATSGGVGRSTGKTLGGKAVRPSPPRSLGATGKSSIGQPSARPRISPSRPSSRPRVSPSRPSGRPRISSGRPSGKPRISSGRPGGGARPSSLGKPRGGPSKPSSRRSSGSRGRSSGGKAKRRGS